MTGTGKTVTVQNLLSSLEPAEEEGGQNVVPMTVNFSAQTSSLVTQVRRVQRGAESGSASKVLPPRQDALNDFRERFSRTPRQDSLNDFRGLPTWYTLVHCRQSGEQTVRGARFAALVTCVDVITLTLSPGDAFERHEL